MARIARVVLQKASPLYDKPYDYLVPTEVHLTAGCRVTVPFGRGNATRLAMVIEMLDGDTEKLKQIKQIIDKEPLLGMEGLSLVTWIRETTYCNYYDAVSVQLPPAIGIKVSVGLSPIKGLDGEELSVEGQRLYSHLLTRRTLTDENIALAAVGLDPAHMAAQELVEKGFATRQQLIKKKIMDERAVMARIVGELSAPSEKQQRVINLLNSIGTASVKEICYFCGVTKSVIDTLRKHNIIELYEEIITKPMAVLEPTDIEDIILSPVQQQAFDEFFPTLETGGTTLLHGVTGSGKTQVFLRLIEETLKNNRQALVLIPEISLTPQTVGRFTQRFGSRVAVINSSLSMTERLDQFNHIKNGDCDIVVGTRSAVFAPLNNIGLIVIDEEQEHTYHSESSPRYHAKSVAQVRAKFHKAPILLCSATPCVESYYFATTGRYNLSTINQRYSKNPLPNVEIIDLNNSQLANGSTIITEQLAIELLYNLEHQEQSILLLNRRGYSNMLKCSGCGEVLKCPHCSVSMTYHSKNNRLMCHCCGYSIVSPKKCPSCENEMMRLVGAGTQKCEEELKILFPQARILRMDADSTMSRFAHQKGFDAFARGEFDIMLGTQMVAKGLDFPNVTLVGIISADQSLYTEDFRGFERTFSLITQAVGRGGRANKVGRAVIQTYSPDNNTLLLSTTQDYCNFYKEEIGFRRVGLYPPYCDLVSVIFSNEKEYDAVCAAQNFAQFFVETAKTKYEGQAIRVLGPAEDMPYKTFNKYRVKILIKCRKNAGFYALLRECYEHHYKSNSSTQISIDMFYE